MNDGISTTVLGLIAAIGTGLVLYLLWRAKW